MSKELNSLIREMCAEYPDDDPRKLALHVAERTPPRVLRDFYADSLVPNVRKILIDHRTSAMGNYLRPSAQPHSPKLTERRDYLAELCKSRVHVGKSEWMSLGDCGPPELKFCIAEREQDIQRVREQVTLFEELLSLLKKHRVKRVAELPRGAVQQ